MASYDYDLKAAHRHLRRVDPALAGFMRLCPPPPEEPAPQLNVFETLLRSIIFQQLSGKAASTIHGRLTNLLVRREGHLDPASLLRRSDDELRSAGVSRSKILSIRDLATRAAEGALPEVARLVGMQDSDIIECLTEVRGVGVWTVQMLLLFRLRRPDVFPLADLGVQKGFARLYGIEHPLRLEELDQAALDWSPYRSLASWYLWRICELPVDESKSA